MTSYGKVLPFLQVCSAGASKVLFARIRLRANTPPM